MLILSVVLSLVCRASEIYYPGTFDPFHHTHFNEVLEAQKLIAGSRVIITPVEFAYYSKLRDGTLRPVLVEYNTRLTLIAQSFINHQDISVSDYLRNIEKNVFEDLEKMANESSDPEKYLLIGVDVLALWKELPNFDKLRRSYRFLISRDERAQQQTSLLENLFARDKDFTFFSADKASIRSTRVTDRLFAHDSNLGELVPAPFVNYFSDFFRLERTLNRFWIECITFARNLAELEMTTILGPLSDGERRELRDLVDGYIEGQSRCASNKVRTAFNNLVEEGAFQSQYLRSTLKLYRGWYEKRK